MEHPELNQEVAKRLFEEGAVLIITGIPLGTEFGIDLSSYEIGERFRGIKMIPPGPHYIYCASRGPYGDIAPRVGFLHYFKSKEILVKEWNNEDEELTERRTSDPELEKSRIRENLKDLDRFLGAYDLTNFGNWRNLTDSITEEGVKKCIPDCGVIRTNIELMSCPDSERPRGTPSTSKLSSKFVVSEDELLPNLKPIPGTAPKFTQLPERIPKGIQPSDISKHYMDCIEAIDKLMENFQNSNDLIEEIQIAFILFLVGNSIEALLHWRKILNILSNSEEAVIKYKLFYMKYLEVLVYQIPRLPEELMEQTDNNTVYKDIRSLLLNSTLGGLSVNAEKLMKKLNKTLKWKFTNLLDENPDDLPVIVDINET